MVGLNKLASSRVADALSSFNEKDFCIVTVGSDGRLEKGMFSPLEIVLYTPEKNERLEAKIKSLDIIDGSGLEVRLPSDSVSYAYSDPAKVYPSRTIDSYFLLGNKDLLTAARVKLIDELSTQGRRILENLSQRKKEARQTNGRGWQTYKGARGTHFDLSLNQAYFGLDVRGEYPEFKNRSFKNGPLRYIQIAVEQAVCRYLRMQAEGKQELVEFLDKLPTSTVDRIGILADMDLLKIRVPADLIETYLFFLYLYHTSENEYVHGKSTLDITRHISEIKERLHFIDSIANEGLLPR